MGKALIVNYCFSSLLSQTRLHAQLSYPDATGLGWVGGKLQPVHAAAPSTSCFSSSLVWAVHRPQFLQEYLSAPTWVVSWATVLISAPPWACWNQLCSAWGSPRPLPMEPIPADSHYHTLPTSSQHAHLQRSNSRNCRPQ